MRWVLRAATSLIAVACAARDEAAIVGGAAPAVVGCEIGEYLQQRRALNVCEEDDDCVEVVPEPCFASYYANAASAQASLRDVERELASRCGVATSPGCVRPPLGVPRCRRHRCVAGKLDREARAMCWSIRIPLLEFGERALIYSRPHYPPARDISRSAHLRLDEPGTLSLRVEPQDCALSVVELSRRNSAWGRRFPAAGGAMTITEDLEAGEYVVLARGPAPSCPLEIVAEFRRADGTSVPAKYHGLRYSVACE